MKLRGLSLSGDLVIFDVKDVPARINDKMTVLTGRPNSPIILTHTIVRGLDDESLFESDYVVDENGSVIGMVIYSAGFKIWDGKESITDLSLYDNISFQANKNAYKISEMESLRDRISFNSNGHQFVLSRIIFCSEGDTLWIGVKSPSSYVSLKDTRYCTGVRGPEREYYFGQKVKGGIVEMHDYKPMLRLPNGSYEILKEESYADVGAPVSAGH